MILREREYVLSRGNQKGSEEELEASPGGRPYDEAGEETLDEAGSPYDEPGTAAAEEEGPEGEDASAESSGGGYRPTGAGNGRKGDYAHQSSSPPPADLPDGSDDDVVARQIREAASQEKDPDLREKLWAEYRKYKKSN